MWGTPFYGEIMGYVREKMRAWKRKHAKKNTGGTAKWIVWNNKGSVEIAHGFALKRDAQRLARRLGTEPDHWPNGLRLLTGKPLMAGEIGRFPTGY